MKNESFWQNVKPGDLVKDKRLDGKFSRMVDSIAFADHPEETDLLVLVDITGQKYFYRWHRIQNHMQDYEIIARAQ